MNTRRTSQALSLALAGIVTLAVLGGLDRIANPPAYQLLLASQQARVVAASASASAPAGAVTEALPRAARS